MEYKEGIPQECLAGVLAGPGHGQALDLAASLPSFHVARHVVLLGRRAVVGAALGSELDADNAAVLAPTADLLGQILACPLSQAELKDLTRPPTLIVRRFLDPQARRTPTPRRWWQSPLADPVQRRRG